MTDQELTRCTVGQCRHFQPWGDVPGGKGKGRCWKKSRPTNPGEPWDGDRTGAINVVEGAECCLRAPAQEGLF